MEEGGESGAGRKHATPDGNPNSASSPAPPPSSDAAAASPSRMPFTSLSQVDADYALARVLQDQERAYARLSSNGFYYESSEDDGSYDYEDDEYEESDWNELDYADRENDGSVEGFDHEENTPDANEPEADPAEFENDETFARTMQQGMASVQLMHLTELQIWSPDDAEDRGSNSQDTWQEIEQDEYSYEELIALGEVVGTESRGLPSDTIAALPTVNYKPEMAHDDNVEQCVICRLEYEDGDSLVLLSCKHKYHSECIDKWLQINKVCPVCNAEVSTSGSKKD